MFLWIEYSGVLKSSGVHDDKHFSPGGAELSSATSALSEMNGDGLLCCLGSPYAETYREFIAFTTRLYDKLPCFSPPTLSHILFFSPYLTVSLCVTPALCWLCYLVLFFTSLSTFGSFPPFHLTVCTYFSARVSLTFHR